MFLTGCQTTQVSTVKSSFNPTVLEYKYSISENSISSNDVTKAIAETIQAQLSGYPDRFETHPRNSDGSYSSFKDVKGKTVSYRCNTPTTCNVEIKFENGEYYITTKRYSLSKQQINIPITFEHDQALLKAKVAISGDVIQTTSKNPLFIPYKQFLTGSEVDRVLGKIAAISPDVVFSKSYKGEVESDVDDTIVYANFKRSMGFYKYESDYGSKNHIGKNAAFALNTKQGRIPLRIETYPSRKGSITSYEFTMNYQAKPDGSTTFDQGFVDGTIRTIENTVRR
jgi:hypothetical protein